MNKIIEQFWDIIQDFRCVQERSDSKISELKIRIIFRDNSILEHTEIKVHDIQKRKYSFQWMTASYDLIIRWDNAFHHSQITTFPHHKHIGDEKNIVESNDISLLEVLLEIQGLIKVHSSPPQKQK